MSRQPTRRATHSPHDRRARRPSDDAPLPVAAEVTRGAATDRRARYLEIAQRLFAEHGFEGTSTDMIVAAAGGSKATLYKYFPSKEAIIGGLIDSVTSRVTQAHPAFRDVSIPIREALTEIGRATLDAVVNPAAVAALRLCLGEVGRFPELARTVWAHGPAKSYENFRGFVSLRCERGELAVDDTQLAAEHFLGTIAGHIQLRVAMGITRAPDGAERARRVESAVETFLARYGAATPRPKRSAEVGRGPRRR